MRQLVIGLGEVGSALQRALGCEGADLAPVVGDFDVLHICFGWSPNFVKQVHEYVARHNADLVVVHSTVPVGTCRENGWVHSPVRGRHPDLFEGVMRFVKHVGGARAVEAAALLEEAGMRTRLHGSSDVTELGKLVELAQFGVEVAMMHEIHDLAEQHGVDFDEVYSEFGRTYNAGYVRLNEHRFTKPILTYTPGPIGGHCVVPGIDLLGSEFFKTAVQDVRSDKGISPWE